MSLVETNLRTRPITMVGGSPTRGALVRTVPVSVVNAEADVLKLTTNIACTWSAIIV